VRCLEKIYLSAVDGTLTAGGARNGGAERESWKTYDTSGALGSLDVDPAAASARIVGAGVHDGSARVFDTG
jgi:hypothetical protein